MNQLFQRGVGRSLMYIVLALECVWIKLFIVDTFNLNCCVEEVVFAAKQVCNLGQGLERLD